MDPDAWRLLRLDRDAPRATPPDLTGPGSPAFVGRVTTTGTTSSLTYIKVNPVIISGAETEGGSGTLTVDTSTTVVVLFLGPGTTTVGDDLVVKWGDYRWVAVKKAASTNTVALTSCPCTATPTTLLLTVNSQPGTVTFNACTLVYGPIPSAYTAALGTGNAFLSTASFVDSIGETYQWYFFCSTLVYGIRRIYAHSVFGNPFLDSIRYCWPLSSTDNTCTPTWALRKGNNINGCGTGTTQTAVYVDPGP